MTIDELLTRTLTAEADSRDVDVAALHQDFLRRIPAHPARSRRPALVAIAAAGTLVVGTAGWLAVEGPDEENREYVDAADGRVDSAFTCPVVNTIDFRTAEDDGFLPDLSKGQRPADVASSEHAATFDFSTSGDKATLRLGNADGSLGSVTTYALVDGVWEMRTARVCAGVGDLPLAPTAEAMRLGEHGAEPWPAHRFYSGGVPAAFVDDRPYYNLAGVIEGHRSMYVQPCERGGWCWVSGEPGDYLIGNRVDPSSETGRPHDVSDFLVDPDMMVGRENPFAIWAYDVDGAGAFAAILRDGTEIPAKEVIDPAWDGRRVLVVLATRADVVSVEFTDARGQVTTWRPGDIPED